MTVSIKTSSTQAPRAEAEPFRVMVVDDSAVIRGFLTRYLEADDSIRVVSSASNGMMALRNLESANPDVVVLDIEMPVMDGLTALPKIIEAAPDVKVVMASTLTRRNAEISLRCMQMGAADYVPKPESNREVNANIDFRHELVEKVKVYAAARRKATGEPLPGGRMPAAARPGVETAERTRGSYAVVARRSDAPAVAKAQDAAPLTRKIASGGRPIILRQPSREKVEIVAIGASTGGPQALIKLLTAAAPMLGGVPVLVVQHMPATFTPILADHLARASGMPAREAEEGDKPMPGQIFVAPGNFHLVVRKEYGVPALKLDSTPPENFCRPAVDPLFRSLAESYGPRALGVVLTGMGHDGLRGARDLVGAGGTLIAQDETSSIVWGMPGAVATAGLCSAVESLDRLGGAIEKVLGGGR